MSEVKTGGLPHAVLGVLADADEPLPPSSVRTSVDVEFKNYRDINTALSRLYDRGLVERQVVDDGGPSGPRYHYSPTPDGLAALEEADDA